MNPLPWIQLAVTLLTPLLVLAVAWGRLNERDRARAEAEAEQRRQSEKTAAELLAAVKAVDAKVETMRDRAAAHDTRISNHDTQIETLRDDVRQLRALHESFVAESRDARHKLRDDMNVLALKLERASSAPPAPRRTRG